MALYASGRIPFNPRAFAILEFVDGSIYFLKRDGRVNVKQGRALWNFVEY
jgi:hypothetical protein